MFQSMIGAIEFDVTRTMMKAQIHQKEREHSSQRATTMAEKNIAAQTVRAQADSDIDFSKVKRNDLCPCGSGKKFKNCHGRKQF